MRAITTCAVGHTANDEAADGLLKLAPLRAMFCGLIEKKIGVPREVDELFLLGLLSVRDALLNMCHVGRAGGDSGEHENQEGTAGNS